MLYRLAGRDVAKLYARLRDVAQSQLPDVEAARVSYLGGEGGQPVTREQLQRLAKRRNVTILDVRPQEEYAAGHIPGAVSIPLDELADRLSELPDDGHIIAYCRGAYCVLSHDAVRLLTARGRKAQRLGDGMLDGVSPTSQSRLHDVSARSPAWTLARDRVHGGGYVPTTTRDRRRIRRVRCPRDRP